MMGGDDILMTTEKERLNELKDWDLYDYTAPGHGLGTVSNPMYHLQMANYINRYGNTFRRDRELPPSKKLPPQRLLDEMREYGIPQFRGTGQFYDPLYAVQSQPLVDQDKRSVFRSQEYANRRTLYPDPIPVDTLSSRKSNLSFD